MPTSVEARSAIMLRQLAGQTEPDEFEVCNTT